MPVELIISENIIARVPVISRVNIRNAASVTPAIGAKKIFINSPPALEIIIHCGVAVDSFLFDCDILASKG